MNESNFNIDLIFRDAESWRDKAVGNLCSIKLINDRMWRIKNFDISHTNNSQMFEFRALKGTCLFLMGISLENAIKGYTIAKEPAYEDFSEFKKQYSWDKTGHGIVKMYEKNCPEIFTQHKSFLERVEPYLIWAGKYETPMHSKGYSTNDGKKIEKAFYFKDVETTEEIVNYLSDKIQQIWEKNRSLYDMFIERKYPSELDE